MSRFIRNGTWLIALVALAGCGTVEIRISKNEGVRPINRTFVANINSSTFKCGDSIIAGDSTQTYTVTSTPVSGGCKFSFDQEVEILSEADYQVIKELRGALRSANRVEIEVRRMDFYNDVGDRFDVETRVADIELWVNETLVMTREQVGNLPQTITLQGAGLQAIKDALRAKKRCTVHIVASVTILDTGTPTGVRCEFESQPTIILSSASI